MNPKKFYLINAIFLFFLSGCSFEKEPYQETRILLGTYVTIKIADSDKSAVQIKKAMDRAFGEIKQVEALLSSYREDSVVTKINNAGINEVFLDEDTFYILEKAKYFNKISDGVFDVTVLPLLELWGFHQAPPSLSSTFSRRGWAAPSGDEINKKLTKIGSDKMILDGAKRSVRFLKPGMKIDLGGIGKGYAVDRAILVLRKNGIKNALVAAAGDIYCMGKRAKEKKWSVGVRDPRYKNRIVETVDLEDMAISTSGGYEQFFEAKGKRYSHIIDPKTGTPVENKIAGVTIIAKDCLTADALATTVVLLGKERGLKLIKSLDGVKAIVITDEEGKIRIYKDKKGKIGER